MPVQGKVSGAAAFRATFDALPEITQDRMGDAIRTTASEMVRNAVSNVPVDTGTLRDHIGFSFSAKYIRARVGITAGTVIIRDGQRAHNAKATRADARMLRSLGYKTYRASHYAHLVEYGGRGGQMPARPFLGPAFRGQQSALDARMRAAQTATVSDLSNVGSRNL